MAKKNANGEGTIFKRGRDGKWIAELVVGWTGDDQKKVLRHTADTKRACSDWLAKRLAERQEGTLITEPARQTLQAFMEDWISTTVAHEVKPATVNLYLEMLKFYIGPNLGQVPLAKLTPQHVQRFYHRQLEAGLSPRTVQIIHAVLRRAVQQAVDWQMLPRNVIDSVKKPRAYQKEVTALTPEQVRKFLEAARETRLHALFTLAVTIGMRLGELLGLRWQDVNLDAGTLTIAQNLERVGTRLQFNTPKTKASRRTVNLPNVALVALKQWRKEQAQERLKLGEAWEHPELVFTSRIGTVLSPWNVTKRDFKAVLETAGLPKIRFHDLRHSCATMLLAQGVNVKVLQEVLGHANIHVTLQVYTHALERQKKEAAQAIDTLLAAKDGTLE